MKGLWRYDFIISNNCITNELSLSSLFDEEIFRIMAYEESLKKPPVVIIPETKLVAPRKAHKRHRADFSY